MVLLTLPNDILFDSGKSEIKEDMIMHLDNVMGLLSKIDTHMEVSGYTDNVPVLDVFFYKYIQTSSFISKFMIDK